MKAFAIVLTCLLCASTQLSFAQSSDSISTQKKGYWIHFASLGIAYGYLTNGDSSVVELDSIPSTETGFYGQPIEIPPAPPTFDGGCGTSFHPNGYNKIFNDMDEVWQDGKFNDGRLWTGKVYLYKTDGTPLAIKWFMEGSYHSDLMNQTLKN